MPPPIPPKPNPNPDFREDPKRGKTSIWTLLSFEIEGVGAEIPAAPSPPPRNPDPPPGTHPISTPVPETDRPRENYRRLVTMKYDLKYNAATQNSNSFNSG